MAPGELVQQESGTLARWQPPTVGPVGDATRPFDTRGLSLLDEVIDAAERATGLRFSIYLGDLGPDSRSTALGLLAGLGDDAPSAALIAVSPGQRIVEVVTGVLTARRITDRAARLAVLSVVSAATEGDLLGALTNGIRTLADQAGTLPERATW